MDPRPFLQPRSATFGGGKVSVLATTTSREPDCLMTFGQRLAYSMGSFANTLCEQARNRIVFFYNVEAGLPAAFTSVVWGIFGIWNAINDPLMGQVTDRTRTRWGRRIPYILAGAIPLGLSFLFLWTPPESIRLRQTGVAANNHPEAFPLGTAILLSAYLFGALFIFDAIYTLVIMAYNSLYTEMTQNARERAKLGAWREGMGVLALILAISLMPELIKQVGYVGMGAVFGSATALGYLVSVLGSKENPSHSEHPVEPGVFSSMKAALASIAFRFHLAANICKEMIFTIPVAMLPYYCKYAVRIDPIVIAGAKLDAKLLEGLLLGIPFLLVIPSLFLWSIITPRMGSRLSWIASFVSFIPGTFIMWQASTYPVALLGTCLIAPGLAGLMMLPHMLISEIIDLDAKEKGKRQEGVFYGINGAAVKLAVTFHSILFGIVMTATGFITPTTAVPDPVQPAAAIAGIRFLMGGVPALVSILGALFLWQVRLRNHSDDHPPTG
jgi:GPH family glycoside/pentoside/hexuronide:cation symporter